MQGLTLDIAGGNLLRLGKDGVILAASHGTRLTSNRRMFVCLFLFVMQSFLSPPRSNERFVAPTVINLFSKSDLFVCIY